MYISANSANADRIAAQCSLRVMGIIISDGLWQQFVVTETPVPSNGRGVGNRDRTAYGAKT